MDRNRFIWTVVILAVTGLLSLRAQDSLGVTKIGDLFQTYGTTGPVELEGDLIYIGTMAGLMIWDVSNPTDPDSLGLFPGRQTRHLTASGHLAVCTWDYPQPGRVIDCSDPTEPKEVAVLESGVAWPSVLQGSTLYFEVDDGWGHTALSAVDLTVPAEPVYLDSILLRDSPDEPPIRDYCLNSPYLYVRYNDDRLVTYDISDWSDPIELSQIQSEWIRLWILDDILVGLTNASLQLFDVSNPDTMIKMGSCTTMGAYHSKPSIYNDYLYITSNDQNRSVYIYDISDPDDPVLEESITFNNSVKLCHVGDYLYCFKFSDPTTVYDMENPLEPEEVWRSSINGSVSGIAADGNLMAVSLADYGIGLVDITDPYNPIERSTLKISDDDFYPDVFLDNNYLIVGELDHGWGIIDAEDPTSPSIVYWDSTVAFRGMDVKDQIAYLITREDGCLIIDISDPEDPQLIASLESETHFSKIKRLPTCLVLCEYVDDNYPYVVIVDISDIENPRRVSSYQGSSLNWLYANYLFWHSGYNEYDAPCLFKVDLEDIEDPEIDKIETEEIIRSLAWHPSGHLATVSRTDYNFEYLRILRDPEYVNSAWYIPETGYYFDPYNQNRLGSDAIIIRDRVAYVCGRISLKIMDITNSLETNFPPFWNEHPDTISVLAGETMPLRFSVGDPNGDHPLGIHHETDILDAPVFLLSLTGDTLSCYWKTEIEDIGEYQLLLSVSDNEFTVTDTVKLTVYSPYRVQMHEPPRQFAVHDAYPNPFNSTLKVNYDLPKAGEVAITLTDIAGRQVRAFQQSKPAGRHAVSIDGEGLAAGVYWVKVAAGEDVGTQKVVLVK
ncbi:T9SS type A sorting domain-containing protein [Calditrichota bacterium]